MKSRMNVFTLLCICLLLGVVASIVSICANSIKRYNTREMTKLETIEKQIDDSPIPMSDKPAPAVEETRTILQKATSLKMAEETALQYNGTLVKYEDGVATIEIVY